VSEAIERSDRAKRSDRLKSHHTEAKPDTSYSITDTCHHIQTLSLKLARRISASPKQIRAILIEIQASKLGVIEFFEFVSIEHIIVGGNSVAIMEDGFPTNVCAFTHDQTLVHYHV
jgi:hypothetical protein